MNRQLAADLGHSLAHKSQAHVVLRAGGDLFRIEAAAIVSHYDSRLAVLDLEGNLNAAGAPVPARIRHGLLNHTQQLHPHRRLEIVFAQAIWNRQFGADSVMVLEGLDVAPQRIQE